MLFKKDTTAKKRHRKCCHKIGILAVCIYLIHTGRFDDGNLGTSRPDNFQGPHSPHLKWDIIIFSCVWLTALEYCLFEILWKHNSVTGRKQNSLEFPWVWNILEWIQFYCVVAGCYIKCTVGLAFTVIRAGAHKGPRWKFKCFFFKKLIDQLKRQNVQNLPREIQEQIKIQNYNYKSV